MEIREETKSTPPEKVQEDLRKTNQVFQNQGVQQQQGPNIYNGHLIDESWSPFSSVALFFCDNQGLSDVCFEGGSLIRFTCSTTTWSKYSILFPKTPQF